MVYSLLLLFLIAAMIMMGVLIISFLSKNRLVVDVGWSLGILVMAYYCLFPLNTLQSVLLFLMIFIWSVRLSGFLLITQMLKGVLDPCYDAFNDSWGAHKVWRRWYHYLCQVILQTVLCSVFLVKGYANEISFVHYCCIVLFFIGFIGEISSDLQLLWFKRHHRGVCRMGLWSISRHPNLFFDWVVWISLSLFIYVSTEQMEVVVAPLLLWIIVRHMLGPYSERQSIQSKQTLYGYYQDDVPMIIPFFKWLNYEGCS